MVESRPPKVQEAHRLAGELERALDARRALALRLERLVASAPDDPDVANVTAALAAATAQVDALLAQLEAALPPGRGAERGQ
jgi:hypothetical protein